MKKKLLKTLAYIVLIITFVIFSVHIFIDFNETFNLNSNNQIYLYIGIGVVLGFITIIILKLVSRLRFFSIYHKKIINVIRLLIYFVILLMFFIGNLILVFHLLFLPESFIINQDVCNFFIKTILTSLIYSTIVNLFFFSLSIPIKKEDKNES